MYFSLSFCNEFRKKYKATNASHRKTCFWKAQNKKNEGVLEECFGFFFCKLIMYFAGTHFSMTECEGISTYNVYLPCVIQ